MDRKRAIDISKGIGIICVILGHLVTYGCSVSIFIFSFHMPLFFFLSGYTSFVNVDRIVFIKREIKILFSFIWFLIFGIIITLLVPSYRQNIDVFKCLFEVAYYGKPELLHVGQLWFLSSLLIVTVLHAISLFLFKTKRMRLLFSLLCFTISWLVVDEFKLSILYMGIIGIGFPLNIFNAFAAYFFFELGCVMKEYNLIDIMENEKFCKKTIALIVLIIGFLFFEKENGMVNLADCSFGLPHYYILSAVFGILAILVFSSLFVNSKLKLISYIGKNSLPIFALHSFSLYLFAYILSLITKSDMQIMLNIPTWICFLGTVIISGFCVLFVYVYNKTFGKLYSIIFNFMISKII